MAATSLPYDILRAWQRIEFFQPYTLEKKDTGSLCISLPDLQTSGDKQLPWLSSSVRQHNHISEKKVLYNLYIGLFEKSVANEISQQVLGTSAEERDAEELAQRLDTEGTTCFAKIPLNHEGTPDLEQFSISALPWALGHLRSERFDQLEPQIFSAACNQLKNSLDNFRNSLRPVRENGLPVLRAENILTLMLTILTGWADFSPQWQCAVRVDWLEPIDGKTRDSEEAPFQSGDRTETDEETEGPNKEFALPILNSFFLEDIGYAAADLQRGRENKALSTYLSRTTSRKPDLYLQEGLPSIINNLHPSKMPLGRWPSEPKHAMSLMQQFAINTAVEELADGGLLSVNGPPGTGKTTLLRDLVAHNIVERATILASFENAGDTLDNEGFIVSKLTGFEMVVASSNNAAVENISKELPQKTSLAEEFRSLDFLAPIANQMAAEKYPPSQRKKEEGVKEHHIFKKLEDKKQCWGLISAALGNKGNRKNFTQRFFFDEHFLRNTGKETSRPTDENFLNLWRWRFLHDATPFSTAKKRFSDCLEQTQRLRQQLETFADLLNDGTLENQIRHARQQQQDLENAPFGWLKRLISHKHRQSLLTSKNTLQRLMEQQTADKRNLQTLKQIFPDIKLPDENQKINDAGLQRIALWQNEQINRQRAKLFVEAMNLHQAWLYEVMKTADAFSKFSRNLNTFLKSPHLEPSPLRWWQTLFMFVPVISTTFASLGRMFHGVHGGELGWLMIDEAGQAPPSQAVGGIWRAKRVLVVGDPLQIEPVFTASPPLVTRLCQDILRDDDHVKAWNPGLLSVQQVADRANRWGCQLTVMNHPIWIGIPLWVHRRCIEPMFSLANQIAYEGRMIHGAEADKIQPQPINHVLENHWQASVGGRAEKQYRDSHGQDLLRLLDQLLVAGVALQSIYVITPFKAVKYALCELLEKRALAAWRQSSPSIKSKELATWRQKCVGTVHTFQGKENDVVIFVLGCDKDNNGGAHWAASKPNLLNVALTRAKRHIFIIGDPAVWQTLNGFRNVAQELPTLPPSPADAVQEDSVMF
ncbi:DEAD/DEAH box helicase [Enterobacillus tribolii]|uniref:AAA domain-containing protein n=1 Tax=Enterobacillus tribolii TaxID=1487935 RepID=A0A370QHL9_9GAMM|nr:AAA domain-containing protein [Enterobacillus tribolii]MBW7982585.1 helicase [Enterobacillus tribolii]RDK87865.1 AAA domain-containing protein [Enterobacillus tribolii]